MFVAPGFQNMSEQEDSHKTPAKKKKKNGSVERKTYRCKVKYIAELLANGVHSQFWMSPALLFICCPESVRSSYRSEILSYLISVSDVKFYS
jgi:hypothetical protein